MAEGAELKSENWVMVVSEQHRYQGVSYKSDIIVISGTFYFFSSFLIGLKWPWMIWSHFDNAETLNSNTSVLVLLRLDTSPKRVALLTAPNSPCCLFVWTKTLCCHFWKYTQLEKYCYCGQVRCRAVWHHRRQLFPEAVSFIQRPLHHECARFLKTSFRLACHQRWLQ